MSEEIASTLLDDLLIDIEGMFFSSTGTNKHVSTSHSARNFIHNLRPVGERKNLRRETRTF